MIFSPFLILKQFISSSYLIALARAFKHCCDRNNPMLLLVLKEIVFSILPFSFILPGGFETMIFAEFL